MQEQWSILLEFDEYAISNMGRVRNITTDLIKKPAYNQQGIASILFMHNGKQVRRSIAPLVADIFLPRHPNPRCDTATHLDGDKKNCCVDNLVWRPRWFTVKYHQQFEPGARISRNAYSVYCVETDEVFIDMWEAVLKYGLLNNRLLMEIANNTSSFPDNLKFEYIYSDDA